MTTLPLGYIAETNAITKKYHTICVNSSNRTTKLAFVSSEELWAAARNGGNGCNGSGSYVPSDSCHIMIWLTNSLQQFPPLMPSDATDWCLRVELEQCSSQIC